jgi:hypothetical protein
MSGGFLGSLGSSKFDDQFDCTYGLGAGSTTYGFSKANLTDSSSSEDERKVPPKKAQTTPLLDFNDIFMGSKGSQNIAESFEIQKAFAASSKQITDINDIFN